MSEKIFIGTAWPYANGPFHVGHIAGVYLPADIFARYHRLKGNEVLMISGSDCNGTPITIRAEREGVAPSEVVRRYHSSFIRTFQALGIGFDLYTQTFTENHHRVTKEFFSRLVENGYISKRVMIGSYSQKSKRFLPDRFVEGICPHCQFNRARGDQCDNCGRLLDPWELIEPHSSIDREPISFQNTEHYFLELEKLSPLLSQWLNNSQHQHWRPNTLQFAKNWLREGLKNRAITRDIDWGVTVPVTDTGFQNKRIYVWFDAVIGYYSATLEWCSYHAQQDYWKEWWRADTSAPARCYYFIGKDNIPFHAIFWPAILCGYGGLVLPYDIPASEFLTLKGEQMSTSRNWAVWLPDIEERYQPDLLRYYLSANAPESRDGNWSWHDFVRRVNDELIGHWGNYANRMLSLAFRLFGDVPTAGELTSVDKQLLAQSQQCFAQAGALIERVRLKAALQEILGLAKRANQYISEQQPWNLAKCDKQRTATVIYTGLQLLNSLKLLLSPFLPHSCQHLHELLGYQNQIAPLPQTRAVAGVDGDSRLILTGDYRSDTKWEAQLIPSGQKLQKPIPLFGKLVESVAEVESEKIS
ncbi:MAG: methionine--tRNA ligase [Acidobacteriota bacterium]